MTVTRTQLDTAAAPDGKTGVLYVVATPIGNLADLSARAQAILAAVDLIACEDTRHSARLLTHLGINRPLCAYHDHNEAQVHTRLLDQIASGQTIALISDAGTPLISDPGFRLVRTARLRGLAVVPIPGPSALICALSGAGLPSDRFLFLGFAPRTGPARRTLLQSLTTEPGTLIFYESGQRILAMLADCATVLGATRQGVIARELTKRFETFLCASLGELSEQISADEQQQRGELVLLIAGAAEAPEDVQAYEVQRILEILCAELPLGQAATLTARITGAARNPLYRAALARKSASQ